MEKEVLKERLTKLVEIGLSKNKTLDFNDVNDFFAGETLTPEELEFVYTYLERKKIDVLRAATEDMAADDFDKDIDFSDDEEDVDLDAIDLLEGVGTGLGAVTPIGNTVEEFWDGIKEGKVGIGEITKFDTTEYKVKIAAEVKDFQAKDS